MMYDLSYATDFKISTSPRFYYPLRRRFKPSKFKRQIAPKTLIITFWIID